MIEIHFINRLYKTWNEKHASSTMYFNEKGDQLWSGFDDLRIGRQIRIDIPGGTLFNTVNHRITNDDGETVGYICSSWFIGFWEALMSQKSRDFYWRPCFKDEDIVELKGQYLKEMTYREYSVLSLSEQIEKEKDKSPFKVIFRATCDPFINPKDKDNQPVKINADDIDWIRNSQNQPTFAVGRMIKEVSYANRWQVEVSISESEAREINSFKETSDFFDKSATLKVVTYCDERNQDILLGMITSRELFTLKNPAGKIEKAGVRRLLNGRLLLSFWIDAGCPFRFQPDGVFPSLFKEDKS